MLNGPLSSYNDVRIIPDFVCTVDTLACLRKEYQIPDTITLSPPHRGYDVYTPHPDLILLHVVAFECGVRLPLHPILRRVLYALELTSLQISSEFWKHMTGFLVLWREQCERDNVVTEPGFDEIWYVF